MRMTFFKEDIALIQIRETQTIFFKIEQAKNIIANFSMPLWRKKLLFIEQKPDLLEETFLFPNRHVQV